MQLKKVLDFGRLALEQLRLRLPIPTVIGNVDYKRFEEELTGISRILIESGVERQCVAEAVVRAEAAAEKACLAGSRKGGLSAGVRGVVQGHARRGLRCNVLRIILGEDFRGMSRRLAEAPLLRWFCGIDGLDVIKVPTKSTLQRYSQETPEQVLRDLVLTLVTSAAKSPQQPSGEQKLGLKAPLDLAAYFVDTTCLKLNIHFPVDWVLLRDAARTLMKATLLIRRHGLKARMQEPRHFLGEMNRRCMEMTQKARRADGKKERKRVLREMERLSGVIKRHAQRHRELLSARWSQTDLSQGQARQIIGRIDGVLEKLPKAIEQAHERLIRGRQVTNKEKLLSMYESHAEVYVRGKAGASVEFGSQLFLGEQRQGVILDWALLDGEVRPDSHLFKESLERLAALPYFDQIEVVVGDRGFDTKDNSRFLKSNGLRNALCPKPPQAMAERRRDWEFRTLQTRRGQTEGRIGIFKNVFTGNPILTKGAKNQAVEVAWAVLTHNLWVITRLPRAEPQKAKLAA